MLNMLNILNILNTRYLQDAGVCYFACLCTLLGLCYSILQSLKGTQIEKYSINTLYDETVRVYEI